MVRLTIRVDPPLPLIVRLTIKYSFLGFLRAF